MTYAYTATERKRVSFGKIPEAMELPNLISVQRESFERFKDEGLREAFKESSPIQSQNHVLEVTFGEHQFGDPAHTVEECREKDMTYQAPLLTDVRLTNKETGEIKEQLVFMGDFPMMTDQAPSSSTVPSVSSSRSSSAPRACTTAPRWIRASRFTRPRSSRPAVPGLSLRSTSATSSWSPSTVSASRAPRCSCAPLASPSPTTTSSSFSATPM